MPDLTPIHGAPRKKSRNVLLAQYREHIARLEQDQGLERLARGDVLRALDKNPSDPDLLKQIKNIDSSIAARANKIAGFHDRIAVVELGDEKALAAADAEATAAAAKKFETHCAEMMERAPDIDHAIASLMYLFTAQEADSRAAIAAGRAAGIEGGALLYLLDMNPLGVALADRLSRGGWTKLPFLDVTHPRNTATIEQMTTQRHEKVLALLTRARNKGST